MLYRLSGLLIICFLFIACESSTEPESKYNPPADHTVSKDGIRHKPGLSNPAVNCVSCHGADLKGDTGPSCYTCHGKKW